MLFKVALAVALGSIGLIVIGRMTGSAAADDTDREQARLERTVATQLQSLRKNLFKR